MRDPSAPCSSNTRERGVEKDIVLKRDEFTRICILNGDEELLALSGD
jgi:hypothetical protein